MESLPVLPNLDSKMVALLGQGQIALNRQPDVTRCQLRAKTDVTAVYCWLNEYVDRHQTFRNYQKEVDRLLLWCVTQHKKPLSQLDRADLDAYLAFCQNPQPYSLWCSQKKGRGIKRGEKNWKPFAGPLKPAALHYAMTVLQSLFRYLVDAQYLLTNPLTLMRQQKRCLQQERKLTIKKRLLSKAEWAAIRKTLLHWPTNNRQTRFYQARLRFIVALLFYTGIRVEECIRLTWNNFQKHEQQWWLQVVGKGNRPRLIPATQLMSEVARFRRTLDLSPFPQAAENTQILPLTTGRIRQLIAALGQQSAALYGDELESVQCLQVLSPHMFRHLMATTLAENQVAREHIQASLGHESLATTDIYVTLSDTQRHQAHDHLDLWTDMVENKQTETNNLAEQQS